MKRPVDRVLGGVLVGLLSLMLVVGECFYVNFRVSGTALPVAQVVAICGNLVLPWAIIRLTGHRGTAVVPALLWIVIAVILATRGPGGDVVVPGNWQGIFLLLGGAGAAVVAVVVLIQPGRGAEAGAARADRIRSPDRAHRN